MIRTKFDIERDMIQKDTALDGELRTILSDVGYPERAVAEVLWGAESQETVDRDFHGSWFQALK